MAKKPTYEELEQKVKEFENVAFECKRAEEKLIASEKLYKEAQLLARMGHWKYDPQEDILIWSDELYSIFEIDKDAGPVSIGVFIERIHPEDRDAIRGQVEKGESYRSEYRIVVDNGVVKHIREEVLIVHQEDGKSLIMKGTAQDITSQKQTEEALRASEEKFRRLVEGQGEAIYRMSLPDGKYEYMSPAAKKVFGYSAEEFLENPLIIRKVIHPDFAEYFKEKWADLIEGKVPPTYKYKILDPEGNERWIIQSNTGIFDDSGNIIAIEGLSRDITKRVQAEEALQESESKLRATLDAAAFPIVIVDSNDDKVYFWSQSAVSLFGHTAPTASEWFQLAYPDPDYRRQVIERWKPFLDIARESGKPVYTGEYQITCKDGSVRICELYATFLPDNLIVTFNDITERKRAEEALREKENKINILYNNSPDMYTSVSAYDASILLCNETLLNKTGYSREELIGFPIFKLYHDDCMTEVKKTFQEFVETGVIKDRELTLKRKDGSKIDVSLNVNAIRGQAGEIKYSVSSWRDITQRKQAELKLIKAKHKAEEGEKRFRAFIEQSPVAIALYNLDGTGMYANQKYLEVLGLKSLGDFIGRSAHEYFAPQFREESKERSRRRLLGLPVPLEFESIALHSDGSEFPMHVAVGAIKLSADETVNISFIANISERKQAEEALRESEERYRKILENVLVGVYQVTVDGKFLFANKKMMEMFGYSSFEEFEAAGSIVELYARPEERTRVFDEILSEGFINAEVEFRRKDGQTIWVKLHTRKTGNKEGAIILEGLMEDVTAIKNMKTQLQQSQKMEAVGTLAGGIAHDFNNILAVILGNAELAIDDVPKGNLAAECLEEIRLASIRAKEMIQQLLSFSRKTDEENKPLNMVPVIKASMKMLRTAIPSSVEFNQHISDEPCNIMGNASQINQIVMNLVTNAFHAMYEEEGLLEVTLEKIILQEEKPCFDWILAPGAYVRLKARDTGKGIDQQILGRIFEPYYTTKDVGKGTGMGLSVVHGIVKRHDGGIRVESEFGKGTVFEIYFPALVEMIEEEKELDGEIKGGSERILFVDDEASIVKLNHQRLESLGYRVKSTTRPLEALEWFRADPDQFDVIITDMTMPKMVGDKLTKEILAIRPDMPVIICTGYSERISADNAEALGARKYIEKPIEIRELAASLREVLEEK